MNFGSGISKIEKKMAAIIGTMKFLKLKLSCAMVCDEVFYCELLSSTSLL
jgi:hypothetical protein